jgi:hypothetical protein
MTYKHKNVVAYVYLLSGILDIPVLPIQEVEI